jgi:hypothetical protein
MAQQSLVNSSLDDTATTITVGQLRAAIMDAIGQQTAKANTVARKGRMQYATKALRELGLDLGVFELEATAKSETPKELLTDQQKAERIMQRNETRGWQTSTEVKLVASGQAETFADAKAITAKERAVLAAEKAKPAPKPAKKSTSKKAAKS